MKSLSSKRIVAKSVDLLVFVFAAIVLPQFFGPLIGFIYTMVGDAIGVSVFRGQSFGKMVVGLKVVSRVSGQPAGLRDSIIRNAPIGVATFFSIIPFWGWLIMVVMGVPMLLIEAFLLMRTEQGHRLGDVMADTEVVHSDHKLWNST
ncbi:MAG: RDD family protein [Xanthomonadaceae bacterium]|nr:RDD family protein [Xanthomonadaceae bacterium]